MGFKCITEPIKALVRFYRMMETKTMRKISLVKTEHLASTRSLTVRSFNVGDDSGCLSIDLCSINLFLNL